MSEASDPRERMEELWAESYELPSGRARLPLFEEAIRIADTLGDVESGFELREALIREASFCGAQDKSLVAYSWLLAQCDRDPDAFDIHQILWEYKWIIGSLTSFPKVSRQQIRAAIDDFSRRCEQAGLGRRPIHKLEHTTAREMGLVEPAAEHFQKWVDSPRGILSDCPACDRNDEVRNWLYMEDDEKAIRTAQSILSGRLSCAEIPHITYAILLLPALRLGRFEDAEAFHRQGYRLIHDNPEYLDSTADHMLFLTLTGNLEAASTLFARHLGWVFDAAKIDMRFEYSRAGRFLMDHLLEAGITEQSWHLPREFPLYSPSGTYDVRAVRDWLDADARELARQFDERNGTDRFAEMLEGVEELRQHARPLPIADSPVLNL